MPKNATELKPITKSKSYKDVGLPGCCGSMDVTNVRWSQCHIGDLNREKGKESFPTLAVRMSDCLGGIEPCKCRGKGASIPKVDHLGCFSLVKG